MRKDLERFERLLELANQMQEECEAILDEQDEEGFCDRLINDAFGISFTLGAWIGHLDADIDEVQVAIRNGDDGEAEDDDAEDTPPKKEPDAPTPRWLRRDDRPSVN